MSHYTATITWQHNGAIFTDNKYSRQHRWQFDGGIQMPASASPHVVPLPFSTADSVDPEETYGFVVDTYRDEATGVMGNNAEGKLAMTKVTLRPQVTFSGDQRPTKAQFESMHHEAHEECFIANSVKMDVRCEPRDVTKL